MSKSKELIKKIFQISNDIRYVAIYLNGNLETDSKPNLNGASSGDSDQYEELLVNPTLLLLTKQRGNIDCGGCQFIIVRYGHFFQLVRSIPNGHLSVCIEPNANPIAISQSVDAMLKENPL